LTMNINNTSINTTKDIICMEKSDIYTLLFAVIITTIMLLIAW